MRYVSTRGGGQPLSFAEVLLSGTAPDGGLYVPEKWPKLQDLAGENLTGENLADENKPYPDLAVEVVWPFVEDSIDRKSFEQIVEKAYLGFGLGFDDSEIVPMKEIILNVGPNRDNPNNPNNPNKKNNHNAPFYLLELFHGPTLAFKDIALQLLGGLLDFELKKQNRRATILTATSGDTGAAAIEACLGRETLDIFVLHPHSRVSEIQRRIMTCNNAPNVWNIAIEGTFDDCQNIAKSLFADRRFNSSANLVAMNSINWARVAAQAVYYVHAARILRQRGEARPPVFCVPTGNFGNIFAGWVANRMGLPVKKLIAANNSNDTLFRFMKTGELKAEEIKPTLSPAMDVGVPSNLERLIFEMLGRDGSLVAEKMSEFHEKSKTKIEAVSDQQHKELWDSYKVFDDEGDMGGTRGIIEMVHAESGIWIDPHTAVGVGAILKARQEDSEINDFPNVVLSTAHPSKFLEIYKDHGNPPELPEKFKDIMSADEKCELLPNSLEAVRNFIDENIF